MSRACLVLCALLGMVAVPGLASAHAILMESQPAASATVPAGPTAVTMRFNSRIDQARSRLELRPAGGTAEVLPLTPSAVDRLEAKTVLAPGQWVLRWQVLAVDGHMTRGDVAFTVKAP